jgi:hypothetical protein
MIGSVEEPRAVSVPGSQPIEMAGKAARQPVDSVATGNATRFS